MLRTVECIFLTGKVAGSVVTETAAKHEIQRTHMNTLPFTILLMKSAN